MTGLSLRISFCDVVVSTNNEVKGALEAGCEEGLVVRARSQTGGYGRAGRAWISPYGGLYCSVLLRPHTPTYSLPSLGLVVSLAARRTLAFFASEKKRHILIKWPNDVVYVPPYEGQTTLQKLCGISMEVHAGGVCAGVGINVCAPSCPVNVKGAYIPAYLCSVAPKLAQAPSTSPDEIIDAVFTKLMHEFTSLYEAWCECGFVPFVQEYNKCAYLRDRRVSIVDLFGRERVCGTVVGTDLDGALVVRDDFGITSSFASGEVHVLMPKPMPKLMPKP